MRRVLAVTLLVPTFFGVRTLVPVAARREAVSQAAKSQAVPSDVDKKFAELTRSGRQSELIKLVPQLEEFIRDYPDYPSIDRVYSTLLLTLMRAKTEPERLQALADQTLARFRGDEGIRWTAYYVKFGTLDPESQAFKALGQQILKGETSLAVLQNAAEIDKADALQLLDKAITERGKRPEEPSEPRLDEMRWSYARTLAAVGRTADALRSSIEVIDDTTKRIAGLEAVANDTSKFGRADRLREVLADRCSELVRLSVSAGRRDLAQRYLDMQQRAAVTLLDRRPDLQTSAAEAYEKLGRTDLALDGLVRALATRIDPSIRDQIVRLAQGTGKNADDFYRRAREIRNRDARPAYPFALVTDDGQPMKLADLKAKAILVSFFFPT
jgi:tetratricopeptide (TPR) repeat protein